MCGISGIIAFNEVGKQSLASIERGTAQLAKRGPDSQGIYQSEYIALGHRRLSIIDLSEAANQPFYSPDKRYVVVFNGEIFNYLSLKKDLTAKGVVFSTDSDTEVLLQLYITEGTGFVTKLNGFFAFAIYDTQENTTFICRDRFGIKPLLYLQNRDNLFFASEMKAIHAMCQPLSIDHTSLLQYFQFNYHIAPDSVFSEVKKLLPGHSIFIKNNKVTVQKYYTLPFNNVRSYASGYDAACKEFYSLLADAVKLRLISDVPLGTFLSGGIDSSVITALAALEHKNINTFSIGFSDNPYFDETPYADMVAKKYATNHHVFSLSEKDLLDNIYGFLDYIDEPFADSSALAVYILSKETSKHVTVALSGDGADELFGGYNKYAAEDMLRKNSSFRQLSFLRPLLKALPSSRNSSFGNKNRQVQKMLEGASLSAGDRYWRWCGFVSETDVLNYFNTSAKSSIDMAEYAKRKAAVLEKTGDGSTLNNVLYSDIHLVLPNDMLTKVDSMSMANSLEVRVPFLDYRVAEFAFRIPSDYKVSGKQRKKIILDSFGHLLPSELINRPKKGFEIPVTSWLKGELKGLVFDDLLSEKYIKEQNIFEWNTINSIKKKLFSGNIGDSHAQIWALLIFQYWYNKYIKN